ncbi:hypothetical protein ACKKBF_B13030 [Auxenochlorella protothecoides x Auxenochlorella symbiontica]
MESSFSNRGDREEDARPALPQRAYLQIALYASGNALAALIGLLLWNLYAVLADYRDAAVYALLCSVALRGPKTWLVDYLERELAHRSILQSLFNLACLPLTTLVEAWMEGRVLMLRWQQLAVERHRQLRRLSLAAATSAGEAPSSPRTPTPRTSSSRLGSVTTLRTLPTLALFAEAGVRALQSRRTSRRRARRQGRRAPAGGGSAAMFRWLFRACLLWGACDWARRAWGGTVQLVLLAATAVMGVGLLFGLLFGLKWYLRRAGASPAKAPRDAASEPRAGAVKRPRFGGAASLRARRPTPVGDPDGESAMGRTPGPAAPPDPSPVARAAGAVQAALRALGQVYARTEASARLSLRRNLHPIVAAGLVAALLLGSSGLSGLLAVRVAQEGRSVVASARDAFPSAWSEVGLRGARLFSEDGGEGSGGAEGSVAGAWAAGGAAAISRRSGGGTTLAAESAAACNVSAGESCAAPGVSALGAGAGQEAACGSPGTPEVSLNVSSALPRGVIEDKGTSSALREGPAPCTAQSRLPAWVQNQGQQALALAQRALPSLETWLEGAASRFLAAQNLTASLTDAKLAYEMVQGPRQCGRREHTGLLVTLAGAEVAAADATAAEQAAAEKLRASEARLFAEAANMAARRPRAAQEAVAGTPPPPSPPAYLAKQRLVTALASAAAEARATHAAATEAAAAARHVAQQASARLELCLAPIGAFGPGPAGPGPAPAGAAFSGVGPLLQAAYAHLWRGRPAEGLRELRAAAAEAGAGLARAAATADSAALPRLASAALAPLGALARLAAGSVGSTAATAVMGGLGVLRLGLGVVKAALQATLFLALLYYLLAAPQDPLAKALGVLPLSEAGRERAALELNQALSGVLLASAKLMAFHGVFTWLTFRVFGVPLAYTAAVLSAVCALLPFIPTYAVALPGSGLLAAQGHIPGAIVLLLVHWGAYYLGDTLILEDIPGGHPYLLSLGILGGIWTFDNPFQGCLFGPILLSLLSAFYRLHGEFMGMVSADGERGGLGLTTPRAAVPALFASPFGTKGGERGPAPHSPPAPVLQPTPPTPRQGAHKGLELSPVDGCEDRVPARALAPAGTASAENGDSASDTSPLKEDSVPESFSFGYHPHEE